MAKWKCSECGAVLDGRGKSGHTALKSHEGKEVTYTKVEVENDGLTNDNNNTPDSDNINIVGDKLADVAGNNNDASDKPTDTDNKRDNETKNEVNSIQIIDSNTGKKEKGIVDQIFEKAFSEEFAPITTSLLGALVARLQQPNNATEEGILTAEDGSKHAMI